jgi:hypothetical protein
LTNAQFLRLGLVKEQHSIYKIAARFAYRKKTRTSGKRISGLSGGKAGCRICTT